MKILILSMFLLSCLNSMAMNPDDFAWELKKNKDGIKIYTAPQHEETGIVPIKADTTIDDSLPRILTVLADTERKKEWVPNLIEARTIEIKSKYELTEYSLYNSPWPLHDRSFVISNKGSFNPQNKTVFIEITSIEHPKVPHNSDYVRGNTYIGSIHLKALGPKKTSFEIILLTDFNGNVPAWIINIVQRKWPFGFFKNIKEQLSKDNIKVWPKFQEFGS